MDHALITNQFGLLAVLTLIPALIFYAQDHQMMGKLFKIVPALVFAYFIPTLLTFFEVIPSEAPIYGQIKKYVLPASLLLLTLRCRYQRDLPAGQQGCDHVLKRDSGDCHWRAYFVVVVP